MKMEMKVNGKQIVKLYVPQIKAAAEISNILFALLGENVLADNGVPEYIKASTWYGNNAGKTCTYCGNGFTLVIS